MNKSVLISIQPKWCKQIADGSKMVEIRKTKPSISTPFKCYIYCTKARELFSYGGGLFGASDELYRLPTGEIKFGDSIELMCCNDEYSKDNFLNGKIIGEFVCDRVDRMAHCGTNNNDISLELVNELLHCTPIDSTYLNKCQLSYRDIVEYANHRDVYGWHISDLVIYDKPKELSEFGLKRPPQSWCYVEEVQ